MSIVSILSTSPPSFFFFNDTATTEIYTLSLHTLFRSQSRARPRRHNPRWTEIARHCHRHVAFRQRRRSEEHTSELQSHVNLVCRLLLEKKNKDEGNKFGVNHAK